MGKVSLSVADVAIGKVIEGLESDSTEATLKLTDGSQLFFAVSGLDQPRLDITVRGVVKLDASDLARNPSTFGVSLKDLILGRLIADLEFDSPDPVRAVVTLDSGTTLTFEMQGFEGTHFGVRARGFVEVEEGDLDD